MDEHHAPGHHGRSGLHLMAMSALMFSMMATFVKMGKGRFPVQELITFRCLFIMTITLPILIAGRLPILGAPERRGRLFLRGVLGFCSMSAYFWTLTRLPVADAIVIQYTNPIFTTLFATWFLGERGSSRLWLVILLCLFGVAAVAKPGFGGDPLAVAVGLCSAAGAGTSYTLIRSLQGKESAHTIIFYLPLISLPFSIAIAAPEWVWPTGWEWGLILGIVGTSYLGQVLLTKALEREHAGRAMTMNYLSVAFGSIAGWAFFGTPPDLLTLVGVALILGSVSALKRPPTRAPVPAVAEGTQG